MGNNQRFFVRKIHDGNVQARAVAVEDDTVRGGNFVRKYQLIVAESKTAAEGSSC